MKNDEYAKIKALLTRAFRKTNAEEMLVQIVAQKTEILDFLDTPDAESFFYTLQSSSEPEWVARIIDALMVPADLPIAEQAIVEALHDAAEDEEREIGRAFSTLLLPHLPIDKLRFAYYFVNVPRADPQHVAYLMAEPVVQAALTAEPEHSRKRFMIDLVGKFVNDLVRHGITPLTILYAMKAISSMVNAAFNHDSECKERGLSLDVIGEHIVVSEPLSAQLLLQAIETRCHIDRSAAHCLLAWIVAISRSKPFLFFGLKCQKSKTGITFTLDHDKALDGDDPFKKWVLTEENEPVELTFKIKDLQMKDLMDNASGNPALSADDEIEITHNLGRAALSLAYDYSIKHPN